MNREDWRPADHSAQGRCGSCGKWTPLEERDHTDRNTGERGTERRLASHGCETDGKRFEFVPDRWSHTC